MIIKSLFPEIIGDRTLIRIRVYISFLHSMAYLTSSDRSKEPVFSFDKFPNVNKTLGPEMKSTGESIYFIDDLMDDYFMDIYSERNLYLSK